jgi:hypothetical protein
MIRVAMHPGHLLRLEAVPESIVIRQPTIYIAFDPETGRYNVENIRILPTEEPVEVPVGLLRHGVVIQDATIRVSEPTVFEDDSVRTYTGVHLTVTPDPATADRWLVNGGIMGGLFAGARVNGWVVDAEQTEVHLNIAADHLQVHEEFWRLVPEGQMIWRDYRPVGSASCEVSLDVLGEEFDFAVATRMNKGTANVVFYPMPIHNVNGTVLVTPESVLIKDMTGLIRPEHQAEVEDARPTQLRVNGSYAYDGAMTIRVEAQGVLMSEKTVRSIPGAGHDLWQQFRPGGRADLDILLNAAAGEDAPLGVSASCALRNTTASVALGDPAEDTQMRRLDLERMSGTIAYDNAGVELDGVQAWAVLPRSQEAGPDTPVRRVRVLADGLYTPGEAGTAIDVMAYDLRTTREFMTLTPELEQVWSMLKPRIDLDLEASIHGDLDKGLSARVLADIHGGKVTPQQFPMELEQVLGSVAVRVDGNGPSITVEELSALLPGAPGQRGPMHRAGSLQARGQADVTGGHYEFTFSANDVNISQELLTNIPGDIGAQFWEMFHPEGIVSVSGRATYDTGTEVPLRTFLDVNLMDVSGNIEGLPITGASGHVLVTEGRALANQISGVVAGGRFEGATVFYYGPDMNTSYGATLRVRDVKVGQMIKSLTGDEAGVSGVIEGTVDVGGVLGGRTSPMMRGTVELTQARLWETPVFAELLSLLRLSIPEGEREPRGRGTARFKYVGDQLIIEHFQYVGAGLTVQGEGTIGPNEKLRMSLVAIGSTSEDGGIPIVSDVLGWVWTAVEKQLFRVEVRGTLDNPRYSLQPLSGLTKGLGDLLTSPLSLFRSP